ncbi:MAG: hypothetical protein NVSMB3_14150 [Acidobacteriaceae bacterium]
MSSLPERYSFARTGTLPLVALIAIDFVFGAFSASAGMLLPDFDKIWDYGQPAVTEARFRALLPAAEATGADYHLQLLTQIARTQGLQAMDGKPELFAAAHATLDQVERALDSARPVVRVRYLLERGRALTHPTGV